MFYNVVITNSLPSILYLKLTIHFFFFNFKMIMESCQISHIVTQRTKINKHKGQCPFFNQSFIFIFLR